MITDAALHTLTGEQEKTPRAAPQLLGIDADTEPGSPRTRLISEPGL